MLEIEVHQQLRAFLRERGEPYWPHHLTMARLVARALRLGRSVLLQVGAFSGYTGQYRLSYLMPALVWPGPVLLVTTPEIQQRILWVELPRLRQWIPDHKPVQVGDRWPKPSYQGVLMTTSEVWCQDQVAPQHQFPAGLLTIIDGVDDLEGWFREAMTVTLTRQAWESLLLAYPAQTDQIQACRIQLTASLFQHPANPYRCHALNAGEIEILEQLRQALVVVDPDQPPDMLPQTWAQFWQACAQLEPFLWASVCREQGQVVLHCTPIEVRSQLSQLWLRQPVVLVGSVLDTQTDASVYRHRLGLGELTCLKFSPHRQNELIQLYVPDRFPMPNTEEFQAAVTQELRMLLCVSASVQGPIVILVGDVPLKAQLGSVLAAEFGSRVQVEKTCLDSNGILVSGWEFWQQNQHALPCPELLIVTTLPIPSLEDPFVASQVAYYKKHRQDWSRMYLLPEAFNVLQRAIAPIRESQGVVALLDSRVNYRSYGKQVIAALSPCARINYFDTSLFDYHHTHD